MKFICAHMTDGNKKLNSSPIDELGEGACESGRVVVPRENSELQHKRMFQSSEQLHDLTQLEGAIHELCEAPQYVTSQHMVPWLPLASIGSILT